MEDSKGFVAFPAEVLYPGGGNKRQYYNQLSDSVKSGVGFPSGTTVQTAWISSQEDPKTFSTELHNDGIRSGLLNR
ncbi:hypothetical protein ACFOQM_10430 [Paenibacillus sp. GCM10012307]|uniref:Uncharacterized protein n=1 Tax=Paenibacillus roseus TaxID=2798579 RepID=A0A934J7B7_9BACL|nr:hypothetical protein [Paenibacillus roseus]MBJ6361700.1 hypothetical protein [Paenibacillus roseus]